MARTKQVARKSTGGGLGEPVQLGSSSIPGSWSSEWPTEATDTVKVEETDDATPVPEPVTAPFTPPPTVEAATPKPADRSAFPNRTFEQQQRNDRNAARNTISKDICKLQRDGEWARMTLAQRQAAVVGSYERVIEMRGRHPMFWSARARFPDFHDERTELEWLGQAFRKSLELELEDGRPVRVGRGVGSYEESKDEDDEEEETVVKRESGQDGGEDEDSDEEDDGDGEEQDQKAGGAVDGENQEMEMEAKLQKLRKRKRPASEQPSAKRAKTERGRQDRKVEEAVSSDDEETDAEQKQVFYTAVSRGMAICDVSKARRDRVLGWPWAKAARIGRQVSGESAAR